MNERRIHQIFEISVLLKGAHAVIECLGGVLLFAVSHQTIGNVVNMITQDELVEDPNDLVARFLHDSAQGLSVGTQHFYAIYLLSHGVIKLALVVGLLREKLWAYPASLFVMVLFIVYQVYRFALTQSPGLVVLTVLDLVVIVLIWHEYRLVRRHLPTR